MLSSFYASNKMFAKFKSANQTNISPIDNNPITQFFEVGKLTACAGPELVWKIHESFRKSDGKVNSHHYSIQFFYNLLAICEAKRNSFFLSLIVL